MSRNQASESAQLRVFFLSLLSRNFEDQLSSNFHSYFMHLLRYTMWEEWSLTITKGRCPVPLSSSMKFGPQYLERDTRLCTGIVTAWICFYYWAEGGGWCLIFVSKTFVIKLYFCMQVNSTIVVKTSNWNTEKWFLVFYYENLLLGDSVKYLWNAIWGEIQGNKQCLRYFYPVDMMGIQGSNIVNMNLRPWN